MNYFNSIQKIWKKLTILEKIFYILLILITIIILSKLLKKNVEGFEDPSNTEFITHKDNNIFDKFYVSIYDDLMLRTGKNDFEIGEITQTQLSRESKLLDIGSGTGHHVASFSKAGVDATGVDISQDMVNKAKNNYPENNFIQGDVLNTMLFTPETFTHITCLYFTIYYIKDKELFLKNCIDWLKPGGYIIIHLVDRNNFDPIIPTANPFPIFSPQKYSEKRITTSEVKFDKFDYKCNFNLVGDVANMDETFKYKDKNKIRKNENVLYMNTQKEILSIAKNIGFILHSKIDMVKCHNENQYLYVLKKVN